VAVFNCETQWAPFMIHSNNVPLSSYNETNRKYVLPIP
jgi:hypothetical protein